MSNALGDVVYQTSRLTRAQRAAIVAEALTDRLRRGSLYQLIPQAADAIILALDLAEVGEVPHRLVGIKRRGRRVDGHNVDEYTSSCTCAWKQKTPSSTHTRSKNAHEMHRRAQEKKS